MSDYTQAVSEFYKKNLKNSSLDKTRLVGDCPFCAGKGLDGAAKLVVSINPEGFFHGYFRCLNRCVPGGFPLWYARLAKLEPESTPGYDPDREYPLRQIDYPTHSINQEIRKFQDNLTDAVLDDFSCRSATTAVMWSIPISRKMATATRPAA